PNPATRPPPPQPAPASATNEASTSTSASATRGRGTKRKRGGAVATTTTAHEQASVSITTTTRGGRGSRGERGSRGGREVEVEEQLHCRLQLKIKMKQSHCHYLYATTSVVFGRTTSTKVPTSSRGRSLRGRGARGYAMGKTVHRRGGNIVGIGIMMHEQPRLVREPTRSAQYRCSRGRAFMRGGAVFSTSGRGNMHRMMDWLGTPEQWENDE
ncbi:hypothetical protein MKW92_025231, partial [Papaver armeniacum]